MKRSHTYLLYYHCTHFLILRLGLCQISLQCSRHDPLPYAILEMFHESEHTALYATASRSIFIVQLATQGDFFP